MSESKTYDQLISDGVRAVQQGDFEQAIEIGNQAIKKETETADGYHLLAIAYQHNQQWEKSAEALSEAVENSPYDASIYSLRGFAYMSLGKYDLAEKDFDEAISLEDFEAAHRNMVMLKISQNKAQEGIDYLVQRIQKNPNDVENLELMGMLLEKVDDKEKAQTYFKAAEALKASNRKEN